MRLGEPLIRLEAIDSTNAELKRRVASGEAPLGTVLTARVQTAGYGQRGRVWVSEPDRGLYVSMLLPVTGVPTHLPFVVGLGVRDGLAPFAPEIGLKWVNDLVARRRKLGGMLVELVRGGAVAGVGVNLRAQSGPEAISLEELTGRVPAPEAVLEAMLAGVAQRVGQWQVEGFRPIAEAWSRHSVTLGARVRVLGEPEQTGLAEGLGANGELLLRTETGVVPIISGTVRAHDGGYC